MKITSSNPSKTFPILFSWWVAHLPEMAPGLSAYRAKRAYRERQAAIKRGWREKHRGLLGILFTIKCWSDAGRQIVGRREQTRKWNAAHPERRCQMVTRYAKAHRKENAEAMRHWRLNNPERNRANQHAWYRKNWGTGNNWRIGVCLRNRIRDALKRKAVRSAPTLELLGCGIDELRRHLEIQFRPGMSWDNYGEWHIDHIRPCASYDLTDPEQQRACFNFKNLQPLWAKDNLSKGAKHAPEPKH